MAYFKFSDIDLSGIASAIPSNKVKLSDYQLQYDKETFDSFLKKTGAVELHKAHELQTSSDLGYVAAGVLIDKKQLEKEQIGVIIFVSKTPDYRSPATACVLHGRLGLSKDCIAFDVNLGGSGFVHGIQIVSSLLDTTEKKYGLLIVGDTTSKQLAPLDPLNLLYSDGVSAVLIEKRKDAKPLYIRTLSEGSNYQSMIVPGGGFRTIPEEETPDAYRDGSGRTSGNLFVHQGKLSGFASDEIPAAVREFMLKYNSQVSDYDFFAFNQTDVAVLKHISDTLGIPFDKVLVNPSGFGDTCGNSIPLLLTDGFGGSDQKEIHVLACGFGEGLSWGVADFYMNTKNLIPVIETDAVFEDGAVSHVFQQ